MAESQELSVTRGVLVASGYGIRVTVERSHLVVEDGCGQARRQGRFPRVGSGIERLVVVGHAGIVSLEALRWVHELGAAFVQLGPDGELIAAGAPSVLRDVRIRRAQALALHTAAGIQIGRDLLREKLLGQAAVLDRMDGRRAAREALAAAVEQLEPASSFERLRFVESRAAAAYWGAWEEVPVHFAGRDAKHLPSHWRVFGTRRSVLSSSPRKAASPANAILNYLYALVEAEARLAALAVGLDPLLGLVHADGRARESLVFDLMEPVRPLVDAHALQVLTSTTFHRSDFFELRDGTCRLMPTLTRSLAMSALRWARAVAPVAERVADAFLKAPVELETLGIRAERPARVYQLSEGRPEISAPRPARTPLTGANRSRPATPLQRASQPRATGKLDVPVRCRGCGTDLGKRKRTYCDECLPLHAARAAAKGSSVQRQLRTIGEDGRSSAAARSKHRANARAFADARRAWEANHETLPSPEAFRRELGDAVRSLAVSDLCGATGLSRAFCRRVRLGQCVPHARHWDAIRELVQRRIKTLGDGAGLDIARPDLRDWERRIAPHLSRLGTEGIRRATGLSVSYARRILHGHHVPRPEHWPAILAALGSTR